MELIDREALRKDFLKRGFYPVFVKAALNQAPVIDAVEVVRCEDCKRWKDEICTNPNGAYKTLIFNPYWYCASGERKNNETD